MTPIDDAPYGIHHVLATIQKARDSQSKLFETHRLDSHLWAANAYAICAGWVESHIKNCASWQLMPHIARVRREAFSAGFLATVNAEKPSGWSFDGPSAADREPEAWKAWERLRDQPAEDKATTQDEVSDGR